MIGRGLVEAVGWEASTAGKYTSSACGYTDHFSLHRKLIGKNKE